MTLPSSGPISLTDIQAEFGGPASPISLGSYYKNGAYVTPTSFAPNVPTSGPIALSNFYGARKLSLYTFTYTGDGSFVLPASFAGSLIVNAMLGGGGGGGGGDGNQGGYFGLPGQFITNGTIAASPGDTIQIFTGGGGAGGNTGSSGPGGGGGSSAQANWSTLEMLGTPGNFRYTNNAYCGFLNTYGIWNYSQEAPTFDQNVTVNFPVSAVYNFTGSCDNYGYIYVDGGLVLNIDGYSSTYSSATYVTAGNHTVRLLGINQGGPGSIGLTIVGGFSGGNGGTAGAQGSSGGGGGGGAGTVIQVNNVIQAVAAGGGGGGGAGYYTPGQPNQNTPGNNGTYYGGVGQSKGGDGGAGGGGGGGYNGGAGGAVVNAGGGDQGAYSGENGAALTPSGAAVSLGSNGGRAGVPGNYHGGPGGPGYVTVSYYA